MKNNIEGYIGWKDIDKYTETALGLRVRMAWCMCTMEYYSIIRKNEILPFVTIWMDLKDITLSKLNQIEKI